MNSNTIAAIVLSVGAAAPWLVSTATHAAGPANWSLYGFSGGKGDASDADGLFFDASGVTRRPDGHVEVWSNSLSVKQLRRVVESTTPKNLTEAMQNEYMRLVAERQIRGERLLLESLANEKMDEDGRTGFMMFEAIANKGSVEPHMRVLYEIDCANDMFCYLSLEARKADGSVSGTSTPGDWNRIVPKSMLSRLSILACKVLH